MSSPVIVVSGLGKRYRLGARRHEYGSLRESLSGAAAGAWQGVKNLLSGAVPGTGPEEFWALKDVSFEVEPGEVVGIIGRNGAGKSTLLKILSRITEPTEGRAELRGRVGSLLEVGTGFHPELTGRENIYMSGAILGMRKAEIDRKFDEIVAFADIDKFLDTPCKRYSSGMYVRLGFAVAAHLEPEILVVDEVLAVGDAAFQKKCLGKMSEVSKSGRTVLFVSHNVPMVEDLCGRGILLDQGKLALAGSIGNVVAQYVQSAQTYSSRPVSIPEYGLTVKSVKLIGHNGAIKPFSPLTIDIEIASDRATTSLAINLTISHPKYPGFLFSTSTKPHNDFILDLVPGTNTFRCRIDRLTICSGTYTLGLGVCVPMISTLFFERDFMSFEVGEAKIPGSTLATNQFYGLTYLGHSWTKV